MTRDDLFNINASIVRDLAVAAAAVCPKALIGIISNPVIIKCCCHEMGIFNKKIIILLNRWTVLFQLLAKCFKRLVSTTLTVFLELQHSTSSVLTLLYLSLRYGKPRVNKIASSMRFTSLTWFYPKGLEPTSVNCPVIGGHAGITIIPLISQCQPAVTFPTDQLKALTERIQAYTQSQFVINCIDVTQNLF